MVQALARGAEIAPTTLNLPHPCPDGVSVFPAQSSVGTGDGEKAVLRDEGLLRGYMRSDATFEDALIHAILEESNGAAAHHLRASGRKR
jgi:hypothetical protein